MTSRERVRAVLNHRLPDRIPNGLGGNETAGLHVAAYDKLLSVLGLPTIPPKMNTFAANALFEDPVLSTMEGDIILLASTKLFPGNLHDDSIWHEQKLWGKTIRVHKQASFRENPDGSVSWVEPTHGWNHGLLCPQGSYYFDHKTTTQLDVDFEIPDPDDYRPSGDIPDETLRLLEEVAKKLYNETPYSICMGEIGTTLQIQPGGFAGHMILMMEEPEIMKQILFNFADAAIHEIKLVNQAIGKYADMATLVQDIGDNRGVTIGTELWREIYKPAYRHLLQNWHKETDMKVMFHTCGSVESILSDLIECGVDILNPVQTSAANMSLPLLKERYGKDLIFWGGAYDAQSVPLTATYEEVYRLVSDNVRILGADGNFIFAGVHNLPATIPEHHLKAMLDAFVDHRSYETAL